MCYGINMTLTERLDAPRINLVELVELINSCAGSVARFLKPDLRQPVHQKKKLLLLGAR